MKRFVLLLATGVTALLFLAQSLLAADTGMAPNDSLAYARMIADSLKMEKLFAIATFPYVKGSKWSGVIPVANPTEIPDRTVGYKLLFEVDVTNPDSTAKEINYSLDEVARILNLHVASRIAPKKIHAVILVHGPAVEDLTTNEAYRKRHSIDNPNLKLIEDLDKLGTKFIACGQAMAFFDVTKEELLPLVKISLTAQTVLSGYQMKGFVWYPIKPDR